MTAATYVVASGLFLRFLVRGKGDELLFRVERSRAVIAKTPDFLALAGTVAVPADKRGTPWDDVVRRTRRERAGRRH